MLPKKIHFNGINGATGAPLIPPMEPAELIEWIKAGDTDEAPEVKDDLRNVREYKKSHLGLIEEFKDHVSNLAKVRWGVIYPRNISEGVKDALLPLVQARDGVVLTYNPEAKEGGESSQKFRSRHNQPRGRVDPTRLPYYLLIVGSPADIPFKFQYGLDAEHAVGRLYFDDEADYGRYVEKLLAYESAVAQVSRARRLAFFSPSHEGDEATARSAEYLAAPLAQALHAKQLEADASVSFSYQAEHVGGEAAKRDALLDLLTRSASGPSLIFTASHGLGFPSGHPLQLERQGALVCSGWPGGEHWQEGTPLPEEMFFSGQSLPATADLSGLVVFSFACYSAGTPRWEDFALFRQHQPKELAVMPFVARLPQSLLAAGALAFIGHVEQAWDYSFLDEQIGSDIATFKSTLESILKGRPVGHAMEHFNDLYVQLARELTESDEESRLSQYNLGEPVDPNQLVALWTRHNDARAYVLYGDPFARLRPALMPD
ncbi:MAG TPA: hypothetical protein VGA87_03735 [Pyrinomonadaceae bacterium]